METFGLADTVHIHDLKGNFKCSAYVADIIEDEYLVFSIDSGSRIVNTNHARFYIDTGALVGTGALVLRKNR